MATLKELFFQGHLRIRRISWAPGNYIQLYKKGDYYDKKADHVTGITKTYADTDKLLGNDFEPYTKN